jgi:HPt (histidine-containing phosphotransfer) domain-containing protein
MAERTMNFADLMQQHQAAYRDSLPNRLAQLDALARELTQPAQGALPALEHCAHSIAGTAGTFGFRALSETARELELAVEQARAGAARPDPVDARLAALRRQLLSAIATGVLQ